MFTLLKSHSITEDNILCMHELFYHNIDSHYSGRYRDIKVIITDSKYPTAHPEKLQEQMNNLCEWIKTERENFHPVEFAAQLHKKFVFIHPFKDGNGRVARLVMNAALIQDGYLPAIIPPVLRNEYISLLEKAHHDDSDFIDFIADREMETQKEILRLFHIPIPKLNEQEAAAEMQIILETLLSEIEKENS